MENFVPPSTRAAFFCALAFLAACLAPASRAAVSFSSAVCACRFSAPVSLRTTARIASRTFSSRVRSSRCFSMKLSSSFPSSSSFPA